ncbi:MAG: helix-hairpin-helix domain-containing protein [Verrucomicrobia bacterium]|nr:helix-hairpin-helix domain-containing protein [Verrucomicrobiota bacterium]MDA1086616.1 helix-hairpin-helix domain-containing protein [Verrucomicrobiota bacterium]
MKRFTRTATADGQTRASATVKDAPASRNGARKTVSSVPVEPVDANPLDTAKSELALIRDALASDDQAAATVNDESAKVNLPLARLLNLVPSELKTNGNGDDVNGATVAVGIVDLYTQLASGRVTVALSDLVFDFPPGLVAAQAYEDQSTTIDLPLPLIVSSVNPSELVRRTATEKIWDTVEQLPDPFAKRGSAVRVDAPAETAPVDDEIAHVEDPVEEPVVEVSEVEAPAAETEDVETTEAVDESSSVEEGSAASDIDSTDDEEVPTDACEQIDITAMQNSIAMHLETPQATEAEAVESVAVESPSEVAQVEVAEEAPAVVAEEPQVDVAEEASAVFAESHAEAAERIVEVPVEDHHVRAPAGGERLGGVNLNTGTVSQLMTISGVTDAIAKNVVAYREANGPYKSVFDLGRVPRIGRKTFRKITGMPYSESGHHRSEKLSRLVGIDKNSVYHLPTITAHVAAQPGFAGCVVSDRDGMMLAQTGADEYSDAFCAIAPRMLQQLGENITEVGIGTVRSVSICAGEKMFTILRSGGVYLTAIHDRRKLTKKQFELAERVASELDWMLSYRGYVGS